MAYTLTGHRYIGTGTQPTAVPGYELVDTSSGNLYAASTIGDSWNLIGSVNSDSLGILAKAGGAMSGNPTGAHGFAPIDSPDFTSSVKLDGIDIVTTAELTRLERQINSGLAPQISKAVRSVVTGVTARDSFAFAAGVLNFEVPAPYTYGSIVGLTPPPAQTIPLPIYADGTVAEESDCRWVAFEIQGWWPCGSGGDTTLYTSADPTATRTFVAYHTLPGFGGTAYVTTKMAYMIIGVRS